MSLPFKVHELLSGDELAELERFAREPGRTIDEGHQWLTEPPRSFNVSRGAVGNWMKAFRDQLLKERFSVAGELAKTIQTAVTTDNFEAMAGAASRQLATVILEQVSRLQSEESIDPLELQRMTRSLST